MEFTDKRRQTFGLKRQARKVESADHACQDRRTVLLYVTRSERARWVELCPQAYFFPGAFRILPAERPKLPRLAVDKRFCCYLLVVFGLVIGCSEQQGALGRGEGEGGR